MAKACTITKSTDGELYWITTPDDIEGDFFEYGQLATAVAGNGDIYYVMLADKSDELNVQRVTASESQETEFTESDVDYGEDEDDDDEGEEEEESEEVEG